MLNRKQPSRPLHVHWCPLPRPSPSPMQQLQKQEVRPAVPSVTTATAAPAAAAAAAQQQQWLTRCCFWRWWRDAAALRAFIDLPRWKTPSAILFLYCLSLCLSVCLYVSVCTCQYVCMYAQLVVIDYCFNVLYRLCLRQIAEMKRSGRSTRTCQDVFCISLSPDVYCLAIQLPILFYSILFYSISFHSILFCLIPFYSILFHSILFYSI